jgi:hypothetical protein
MKATFLCLLGLTWVLLGTVQAQKKDRVLIVDGQSNHKNWPETTQLMKRYLEETGRFTVDVATTPPAGQPLDGFRPKFSRYDVVLSNYNGEPWPKATNDDFETFVRKGGGVVIVHAANNAFPEWKAYNELIGLGGWGGRDEKAGPYVYYDEGMKQFVRDLKAGKGGSHGTQHAFQVTFRDTEHPITKGLPPVWMHTKDELYDRFRGPGQNMHILATAYSSPEERGTGRHEPLVLTVDYGKGRVFHTMLGHANESQQCVGFITLLQRGTEWAATGKVTQPVPADFPTADRISMRP